MKKYNEMTHVWGLQDSLQMTVFRETSHGVRRLELSAPPSPGRGEVLKVELMTSGQLFNQAWQLSEAHVRTPKDRQGSESCVLLNTWRCWECGVPGQSVNAPCLFPSILYPIYCCAMFLICMLCNKSAQFKKKQLTIWIAYSFDGYYQKTEKGNKTNKY